MNAEITKPYDLAVCFRIYPGLSGKPAFGISDKLTMVRLNLESFKPAMGNLKVKIWMILDSCPDEYRALVQEIFSSIDVEFIPLQKAGNEATFLKQIEVL